MRTCPECYVELKEAHRQGVEIDYCPTCRGIWLDHGELEKLIGLATHAPYQQYESPPGYQQGPSPSYQAPPPQYGHQPHDLKASYAHYKHHKHHKHHKHPVAHFLGEVFDIFD